MKKLLNTLYVTNPSYFIGVIGENVTLREESKIVHRVPLHNLQAIVIFSYSGMSSKFIQKCSEYAIGLVVLDSIGRLCGRFVSESKGNVLLRKKQVQISLDDVESLEIAKNMILDKIVNARNYLIRFRKQYKLRIDISKFESVIDYLSESKKQAIDTDEKDQLRGIEGNAQATYYSLFDDMILTNKDVFYFARRSRRPPLDATNTLLSFAYTLLAHDCASALEAVGLDSYIGFNHVDRPGRISLALDLVEEFRTMIADRFVLRIINRGQFNNKDFEFQDNGAVVLTEEGRKVFLFEWQKQKYEELTHPFLEEKIKWGLVPHVQAQLLARYLRGDLDDYPAFFWK